MPYGIPAVVRLFTFPLLTALALLFGGAAPAFAESIWWVSAPPTTAVGGQTITARWQVSGFSWVNETTLAYGVTSIEGTTGTQGGWNTTYEASYQLPDVSSPTILRFMAYAVGSGGSASTPIITMTINPGVVDNDPPTVESTSPGTYEDNVSRTTTVTAHVHDETAVDPSTLRLTLRTQGGSAISGGTTTRSLNGWNDRDYEIEFTPAFTLPSFTIFEATLDGRDTAGNALATHTWLFRTSDQGGNDPAPSPPPPGETFSDNFDEYSDGRADRRLLDGGWGYVTVKPNAYDSGGASLNVANDPTGGGNSLRCYTPRSTSTTIWREGKTNKASATYRDFRFYKGDTVRVDMWLYVPSSSYGRVKIIDIENRTQSNNVGVRFQLEEGSVVFNRDKFNIYPVEYSSRWSMPKNRWFNVTAELRVGENSGGRVRMWVDGKLLIDETTSTIAGGLNYYDSVQVGITGRLDDPFLMYMDDVQITRIH